MKTTIATTHFLNADTQRALLEQPDGYVGKEEDVREHVALIKREHKLDRVVLLHLGQNPDGCSPKVMEAARGVLADPRASLLLAEYPDSRLRDFRVRVAERHQVSPDWVMPSAGLDQLIDMIAASFIEQRDKFVVTNPGFFLFDEYSRRRGGVPVELQLDESGGFRFTEETYESFQVIAARLNPKVLWLANPGNPTGHYMPLGEIEDIVEFARSHFITVVVDEAYGEYSDRADGVRSASSILSRYDNLIVLRTLSKAHGLAGLRVGYALTRNPTVCNALRVHRQYFPVSRVSLELAAAALDDTAWIRETRRVLAERRAFFARATGGVPGLRVTDGESAVAMVRCLGMSAADLSAKLERAGILVAPVPGRGVSASQYLRFTYGTSEDMGYFARTLERVLREHLG